MEKATEPQTFHPPLRLQPSRDPQCSSWNAEQWVFDKDFHGFWSWSGSFSVFFCLFHKLVSSFFYLRGFPKVSGFFWTTKLTIDLYGVFWKSFKQHSRTNHNFGRFLGVDLAKNWPTCFGLTCRSFLCLNKLSHGKNPSYFPLYWLVNRDPYSCLLLL